MSSWPSRSEWAVNTTRTAASPASRSRVSTAVCETVAVVTSNYHMPRTLIEFGHALKDEDAIWAGERVLPHPVVSEGVDPDQWWRQPATARLLASEYVKFLAAWLRTLVENDPEHSRAAVLLGGRKPVNGLPGPLVANAAR